MIELPPSALDQLLTPCLVVDAGAASRNIARCASFFSGQRATLRPHFKAHKCTALMRQQVAAGSCSGVACQTSWEALVLARSGFTDILIANQVVDAAALDEAAQAAARASLTVVVDHEAQVDMLARAAGRHRVQIGVLIELDVGAGRCGLPFGDPSLIPLAGQIAGQDSLSFRGLQAYEGHIGDKVLLIPAHVDPAVNLYDRLLAWTGTGFTEWEVDGRRKYRLVSGLS